MLSIEKMSTMKKEELCAVLNNLIEKDFTALVQLLYRVDIDENKLKRILNENKTTDAADLIVDMIIERLEQKQNFKKQFQQKNKIDENEKW